MRSIKNTVTCLISKNNSKLGYSRITTSQNAKTGLTGLKSNEKVSI